MALPEFADQKREQERKSLKVLLSRTLFASLVLHAGLLPFNFKSLWTADEPAPEEIAIVVTDSEEPEVEEPPPLEEETEVLAGSDAGGWIICACACRNNRSNCIARANSA
ncbi:MAG: hypothetical protein HC781_14400 [Leptolyngbyaceae cyanobacterium CSU_1_4]|nr:hypothetical protein [Leptolyngbyaceae cyanobacterium CSU_1_4]